MNWHEIPAVDIHAHFGSVEGFPQKGLERTFCTVGLEELKHYYAQANVAAAVASPAEGIFPFGGWNAYRANENMRRLSRENPWLRQWVILNPLEPDTYRQAEEMLKDGACVGIKIHPDAHGYSISEYGDRIFEFAARHRAVVETHSGDRNSMPEDYVVYAGRYPEMSVILSHLGNGCDGVVTHQVDAVLQSVHGNLYTDVSSAKSILFGLVEWAVKEIGSSKILFGTDAPLHHIAMMRSRVDCAQIAREDAENILYKNAERLLGMSPRAARPSAE